MQGISIQARDGAIAHGMGSIVEEITAALTTAPLAGPVGAAHPFGGQSLLAMPWPSSTLAALSLRRDAAGRRSARSA